MDKEKKPETKSSFWSKNPKRKYLGLWYVIDDYDSAKVAANVSRYGIGGIIGAYIFYFFMNPPNDNLYQTESFELLLPQLFKILLPLIAVFFYVLILRERYGFIPLIAVWMIFEGQHFCFNIFLGSNTSSILIMLIIISMAVNSLRGWRGLAKYKLSEGTDANDIWKQ